MDGALSNLLELKMSLLIAGQLDKMTFKGPFQLKLFYDSVILSCSEIKVMDNLVVIKAHVFMTLA